METMESKTNKMCTERIITLLFSITLLYSLNVNSFIKYIAYGSSMLIIGYTIFLGTKNKIKLDMMFFSLIIYIFYNIFILFLGFSKSALYIVFQEFALLLFAFFATKLKITEESINNIERIFSKLYYCVLILTSMIFLIGKKNLLINNVSMTVYKAIFAISIFPYAKSNKKTLFCIISMIFFYMIGERTSALILVIIHILNMVLKKINTKTTYNIIFICVIIFTLSFINIYVKLPYTKLGIELNEYSRKISGENFFSGRNVIWKKILDSVQNNKLLGLTYSNDIELYYETELSTHNLYLWLILNGGYILLILFYIYMFSIWKKYFKNIKKEKTRIVASYFVGFMILVNFELLLLTNNFIVSLFMWFIIAIGISLENNDCEQNDF